MSPKPLSSRVISLTLAIAAVAGVPAGRADAQCFVNPANGHHYILLAEMPWTDA